MTGIPLRVRIIIGFAIIYVVWGSTYVAIRFAVQTLPPFFMSGVRFLVAGLVLIAWAYWRGASHPTRAQWRAATLVGALLILGGTATVGWAEQWVPSGIASLLAATAPLWIVVMEWMGPGGMRPGIAVIAGIVLGLCGVAVLIGPGLFSGTGSGHAWEAGALALVLGSAFWGAGSIYSSRVRHPTSAPLAMGMQMVTGGALSLAAGVLLGEARSLDVHAVSAASALALGYLVVFGSLIGFTAYLWLLQVVRPSRVATHAYVNPIVAVLLGWALADEPLSARTLLAAAVIIGSVVLITTGHVPETG
jgi:drug/metabolite transporter (DMT)-like permease